MKHPLYDVLINPNAFFQDAMSDKESLKLPALIVLAAGIVAAAYGYMIGKPVAQMMAGLMPGMETIIILSTIFTPLIMTFFLWIIWWAGVSFVLSTLFKGKGTFKRNLGFVGYGYLPQILGSLIALMVSFYYIPKVRVTPLSAASIQDVTVIQEATKALLHDPAMMALTQIVSVVSVVFLLWSATIWIFGTKHARQLSLRDGAICVIVPVIAYCIYISYTMSVM